MKKHRARRFASQGGHAETHLDTDDQKHLRDVVLEEIETVMHKYGCGGVILISSFESSAWRYVLPHWGGSGRGLRLRINSKSPLARQVGDSTLGFIKSMRDFSAQMFTMFDQVWEMASKAIGPENIFDSGYDMSEAGKPKPPTPDDNN
jgi:hypothetical protein